MPELRSPLAHLPLGPATREPAALTAAELPDLGYLVLRGRQDDAAFMAATAAVLGAPLPVRPRSVLRCAAGVVLWQSPDEWWLLCARDQRDGLLQGLQAALAGCFAQVVDNSGGFTSLRVAGLPHLQLLRHLTPYDVEALPHGDCVSTVVSKASMTILRSDPAGVALVFRRSFADYLWRLVERSARPYGLRLVEARQCPDAFLSPLLSASAQHGQRKAA